MTPSHSYREAMNLFSQGSARDLQTLQVKITYLGVQTKPTPTLVFNAYCHVLQMDWFTPLRQADRNYNNDDIAVWHFTQMPQEMKTVVDRLHDFPLWPEASGAAAPHVSLMCVLKASRLGEISCETVLDEDATTELMRVVHLAVPREDRLAHTVLDLHWRAIFPNENPPAA